MLRALERQQASEDAVEEEGDGLSPLQKSKTVPTAPSETSDPDGLSSGISRAFTGTTMVDPSTTMSPESTPSLSSEDTSEFGPASPVTPKHKKYWVQAPMGKARQGGSFSTERGAKPFDPSIATPGDFEDDGFRDPHGSRRLLSSSGESTTAKQDKPQNVGEAVAEAMKTLSLIRQKEQSSRPLRVIRQDPQHAPDEALKKRFQDLVDDELKIRRLNARDWLRVATWWLLKVDSVPCFGDSTNMGQHRLNTICDSKDLKRLILELALVFTTLQRRQRIRLISIC